MNKTIFKMDEIIADRRKRFEIDAKNAESMLENQRI